MKKFLFLIFALLLTLSLFSCDRNEKVPSGSEGVNNGTTAEHVHEYTTSVVAPSCTDGYTVYTCTGCEHSYTDNYVTALGHQYDTRLEDSACNVLRKTVYTCSVCRYSYSENTEEYGTKHSIKVKERILPTKTEGGYTIYACELCGLEKKDDLTDPVDYSVGLSYTKYTQGYFVSGIGTCRDTDIVIPEVNEHGQRVVGIAQSAFSQTCSHILSITVPQNVGLIKEYAFSGCTNLQTLTFVMTKPLADYFYGSSFIEYGQIYIPTSLKTVNILGSLGLDSTLSSCASLTKVTLSDTITTIPQYFFTDCSSLSEIVLSKNITSIGNHAFAGTAIREITIPEKVTKLPERAFFNCKSLKNVIFNGKLTEIGDNAFGSCTSLEAIALPDTLQKLGDGAFSMCSSLKDVTVPTSLTSLPPNCFYYCKALKEIALHDGIKKIGYSALCGTGLKEFKFPKNLVFTEGFLSECKSLTSVDFNGVVPEGLNGFTKCTSLRSITLPEGIKTIRGYAFQGCTALESINIPSTVDFIEYDAFNGCTSLTEISLPEGVKLIDMSTFKGCTSLKTVKLPSTLEKIGNNAFEGCTSLVSISLPQGLKEIGNYAFSGSALTSLDTSELISVGIGNYAFYECKQLKALVLTSNISYFYEYAFAGCTALTDIKLFDGLKIINRYAFMNCSSLKKVELPRSLETIYSNAFAGCTSLESLTIPENVKTVESSAFSGCTALTSLTYKAKECVNAGNFPYLKELIIADGVLVVPLKICYDNKVIANVSLPESITTVSQSAFEGCTALTSIALPESLTLIESSAFASSGLTSVTFKGESLTLGVGAFMNCDSLASVNIESTELILKGKAFYSCDALNSVIGINNAIVSSKDDFPSAFMKNENSLIICGATLIEIDAAEIGTDIIIPEGIRVISANAFNGCDIIKSVKFPSTLISIGDYAFAGCTRLQKAELPSSVKYIGAGAFSGCSLLTEANIPDSVRELPAELFKNCSALVTLHIGVGVTKIDAKFYTLPINQESKLYTVNYEGTAEEWEKIERGTNNILDKLTISCSDRDIITVVAQGSIYNSKCSYTIDSSGTLTLSGEGACPIKIYPGSKDFKKVKKLIISEGITNVTTDDFYVMTELREIELPESLVSFTILDLKNTLWYQSEDFYTNGFYIVGKRLYSASPELEGEVDIPEGIISIGAEAFYRCNKITKINVPASVTEIEARAFYECHALEAVNMPEGVLTLGYSVFFDCDALIEITVPASVRSAELLASHCASLKKLTYLGATKASEIVMYCDSLEILILGEGMNGLEEDAVYSCPKLRIIVIPKSLTSMEDRAFRISSKDVKFCFVSSENAQAVIKAINSWFWTQPDVLVPYIYTENSSSVDGGCYWTYNEKGEPVILS